MSYRGNVRNGNGRSREPRGHKGNNHQKLRERLIEKLSHCKSGMSENKLCRWAIRRLRASYEAVRSIIVDLRHHNLIKAIKVQATKKIGKSGKTHKVHYTLLQPTFS